MESADTARTLRYLAIMAGVYAVWGMLYLLTAWIGALRGPVLDIALPQDASIPLIPAFQHVYMLAYIIVLALLLISREPAFLNRAYTAFILANGTAFAVFALVPVEGPPRDTLLAHAADLTWVTRLILSVDSRYNAFPSLHVANPWLVTFFAFHHRGAGWLSWLLAATAAGITLSTLFVHQHYILDAVGGIVLAAAAFAFTQQLRISPRPWFARRSAGRGSDTSRG